MLASLTLSFPLALALPISWHDHLSVAQQMHRLRAQQGHNNRTHAAIFFERWFCYLDTFGACSGNVYHGCPQEWPSELLAAEKDPELKCLTGYTTSSLLLLARVAEICKRCDRERKELGSPSYTTINESQQIRLSLELTSLEVQQRRYDRVCSSTIFSADVYLGVNVALCHAALIMLLRRAFLLPTDAMLLQHSAKTILTALRDGERYNPITIPDIILPLFLAGCETKDQVQRSDVLRRLERIGNAGMSQTTRVRALLQECWDGRKDWTELDHNVFLG
ncbi:hypothetical protein M8818_003164 [Zalaria obscura]|uniref:Uncharacterized protein n=1 Tax=Zalaria obscura TaxID=2024903 RepID=A0ACC3SFS2_9PEZI